MLAPKRISTSTLVLPNTGPTAKDYIQDGLVAMWDGIENAGWGVHDGEATTWKDLIGDADFPCTSGSVSDSWIKYTSSYQIEISSPLVSGYEFTIQGVYDRSETTGNFCAIGFGYGAARLCTGNQTSFGCRFSSSYNTISVSGTKNSVTWMRSSSDVDQVRLYNGTEDKGLFSSAQSNSINDRTKLCINGENAYGNYRNTFSVGNIRIYNRTLSPEEIAYNYSIDNKRFNLDGNFPKRNKRVSLKLVTKSITAKDYIQDGLVAMWDGIENAGWGVHDENATVWKDLTGNEHTATLTDKGHFETNCLDKVVDGAGAVAEMFSWSFVEIVFSSTTGTRNSLILFASSGTTGKIIWASGYLGQTYGKAFPIASLSSTMYYATEIGSVNSSYYNGLEVENTGSVQAWGGRSKIYIGGRDDNANSDPGKYYALRFYNRVLSPEEIAHNYSIDQVRFGFPSAQSIIQKKRIVGLYLVPPPPESIC